MTSLSWKRKAKNITVSNSAFNNEEESDNEELVEDWKSLLPSNEKKRMLEDTVAISNRLMNDGIQLAEEERFWEAISKFNKCIEYTPNEAKLYEMKAQVLLELNELYPAVQTAELAVEKDPLWSTGYQTLGRAQISYGEIKLAVKSFSKAYHLDPSNEELLTDDLNWALELVKQERLLEKKASDSTPECQNCGKVIEIKEPSS